METNDNNKGCCCCHGKTKHRTDEEQKALINRLNRIEGQIRGRCVLHGYHYSGCGG